MNATTVIARDVIDRRSEKLPPKHVHSLSLRGYCSAWHTMLSQFRIADA